MDVASVVVDVAEERVALLESRSLHPGAAPVSDDEILPLPTGELPAPSDGDGAPKAPGPKQRVVSLDVFRGLTVALMILVDDAGGAFPSINHSPWTGVTLADFVMPFFLFGVGVSVALVFKKTPNKGAATKKVVERSVKLFLLGLLLQGWIGCFPLLRGESFGFSKTELDIKEMLGFL
ncbi:hypothetical protein Taro_046440 [Colocasia esculenta]|uniref:Heparan-alpha-glucosaminide N-acetyltransferase catalytic domain-containing protein n=1 Tax=Colocasia esculenta TaxID=4460 RepID=A0A843WZ72_COLES|nr:hypothetical protein [Colocasia esculenta]